MVKLFSAIFFIVLNVHADTISIKDLKSIKNESIKLDEKQDKLFLYFWAYWCPSCEEKLNHFFPKNKVQFKIPVISINTDSKIKKVESFIEKHKIEMPIILDLGKKIQRFAKVNGVPAWAYLKKNKDGNFDLIESATGFDEDKVKIILGVK